ncbi:hypothetical protein V1281_000233 [Nitrobacteraceae bacterium AZCC 2161]
MLKTAIRHEWLAHLPDFSPPYEASGKVVHRPWFSPEEYKQLCERTRAPCEGEPYPGSAASNFFNDAVVPCKAIPQVDPGRPTIRRAALLLDRHHED